MPRFCFGGSLTLFFLLARGTCYVTVKFTFSTGLLGTQRLPVGGGVRSQMASTQPPMRRVSRGPTPNWCGYLSQLVRRSTHFALGRWTTNFISPDSRNLP